MFESFHSENRLAKRIIVSYLWCTEPHDMVDTVIKLIDHAHEWGVELKYEDYGIISE